MIEAVLFKNENKTAFLFKEQYRKHNNAAYCQIKKAIIYKLCHALHYSYCQKPPIIKP